MGKNSICHLEIPCRDSKKAAEFYKELFGWKLDLSMGEDYIFFQPEEGVGGALSKTDQVPTAGTVFYVEVDDIEAYLAKASELGGRAAVAKTEIPGHGWYGQFYDPDGNVMGLYTGKSQG